MGCCFLRSRNIPGCLMHGRMRMGTSMSPVVGSILLGIVFWLQYLGRMKSAIIIGLKKCPILQHAQSKVMYCPNAQSVAKEKQKLCLLIQPTIGTSNMIIRKKQSSLPPTDVQKWCMDCGLVLGAIRETSDPSGYWEMEVDSKKFYISLDSYS